MKTLVHYTVRLERTPVRAVVDGDVIDWLIAKEKEDLSRLPISILHTMPITDEQAVHFMPRTEPKPWPKKGERKITMRNDSRTLSTRPDSKEE